MEIIIFYVELHLLIFGVFENFFMKIFLANYQNLIKSKQNCRRIENNR